MTSYPPNGPLPLPVATPPPLPVPACGHTSEDRLRERIQPARMPRAVVDNVVQIVQRVAGGDRELRLHQCSDCGLVVGYHYRRLSENTDDFIGQDPEVVQAALAAVLAQPDTAIFSVDIVGGDRHVIPRHHLPAFNIEKR